MPYRRSRLQDYYEELLGGKPSNGGTPAEPERGDSDGWLPSYIPPIEPPTARPELTSGESDGDDTPGPPLDVDPAVQDYERNLYQRLGIGPPHESGEPTSGHSNRRSDADASQTQDTPDTNQARDETRHQAIPPDIAEVQDDFGRDYGLADSISPEGLYACGNLDILLVKQDMEIRPLTFSRCFEQFPTPRIACDFLYAEVPNCSNRELADVERIVSLGMSGDPDLEGDDDSTGSGSEPDGFVLDYEAYLESVYGYQIEWDKASYGTNRMKQLENLARSTNYIVNYLAKEVFGGDERKALVAFQQNFSQSEEYGKLVIYLGADRKTGGAGLSRVPLQESLPDQELRKMYLGSLADIPTIVHEFGHVVDRSRGFTDHFVAKVPPYGWSNIATVSREYAEDFGSRGWGYYSFNLDGTVHVDIIEGFVAKQYFVQEFWADLFMTAVLDPAVSEHTFYVRSIDDEMILRPDPEEGKEPVPGFPETKFYSDFDSPDRTSDRHFYKCSDEGITCVTKPVMWENTEFAEAAQWYLPIAFEELLLVEKDDK